MKKWNTEFSKLTSFDFQIWNRFKITQNVESISNLYKAKIDSEPVDHSINQESSTLRWYWFEIRFRIKNITLGSNLHRRESSTSKSTSILIPTLCPPSMGATFTKFPKFHPNHSPHHLGTMPSLQLPVQLRIAFPLTFSSSDDKLLCQLFEIPIWKKPTKNQINISNHHSKSLRDARFPRTLTSPVTDHSSANPPYQTRRRYYSYAKPQPASKTSTYPLHK